MTPPGIASFKGKIHPAPPRHDPRDVVSTQAWGYRDTTFAVDETGAITVTGDRYPGLSGERFPICCRGFAKLSGSIFR